MDMQPIQVVVCDARSASRFRGTIDAPGRLHLAPAEGLPNHWIDFHEHHRPSALGMGPSANAAQHFAGIGHEPQELDRRFARDVGVWIKRLQSETRSVPMAVFAAPRFLGFLRDEIGPTANGLALYRGEFTSLRAGELAAHPTVRMLIKALVETGEPITMIRPSQFANQGRNR